jgi:hypothetical protein
VAGASITKEDKDMYRHDDNTPASPAAADPPAGSYLISENHYRQLEAMRDDLLLLAHLSTYADPERHVEGLPMKTLANSAQRAVHTLNRVVISALWQPQSD